MNEIDVGEVNIKAQLIKITNEETSQIEYMLFKDNQWKKISEKEYNKIQGDIND